MIYDMRIYDLVPGAREAYMEAAREVALPVRRRYGIKLAGWFYSEVGTLNRVVHIWAFRDWAHMEACKTQMRADPEWVKDYVPRVLPLIVRQTNQIMEAADFFPEPV